MKKKNEQAYNPCPASYNYISVVYSNREFLKIVKGQNSARFCTNSFDC